MRQGIAVLVSMAVFVTVWGVTRTQAEVVDLALVSTASGVSVLDTSTGEVTSRVRDGVPSPDGSVVVRAMASHADTVLLASDAGTGEHRWRREVQGEWAIRLVAQDGLTVVLGAPGPDGLYTPVARARTRLLVSTPGSEPRRYDLAGNYEPEAMATDRSSMFVVSYLPPTAPERYQVRRLDLASGDVLDVFTPDAHLQQEMGGTARTQVWSSDGRRLYTLYTLAEPAGARGFVHVLDLDELWAHCIDLPEGMAVESETSVAMAVGGERLYVADRAAGVLAEIDTVSLAVARTTGLARMPHLDAVAASAADARLFLGSGRFVEVFSPAGLEQTASWRLDGDVAGLQPSRTGEELVAVLRDGRVVVLDAVSGEELRRFTAPGGNPVLGVGGSAKRVPGPRDTFDCAC